MRKIRDNVQLNLKTFLSARKLSQKEFAKQLGVSQAAVTNWIQGNNSPDIEMVAKICDVLEISISDLFGMDSTSQFSLFEQELIFQYRKKPELHLAIQILLDLPQEK